MPATKECFWCYGGGGQACWITPVARPDYLCDGCLRFWHDLIRPIDADEVSGYKPAILNRLMGIKGKKA